MSYFYTRLEEHLKSLGLTFQRLHYMAEIQNSQFSFWRHGKRSPSESEIQKIANVKELGLRLEVLQAWAIIDKYGEEAVKEAIELVKERNPEKVERALKAVDEWKKANGS